MSKTRRETMENREKHKAVYDVIRSFKQDFIVTDICKITGINSRVLTASILALLRSGCIVKVGSIRLDNSRVFIYRCTYKKLDFIAPKKNPEDYIEKKDGVTKTYLSPNHYRVTFGANVKSGSGQSSQVVKGFSSLELL